MGIKQDSHWPVVTQGDLHHCLKNALLNAKDPFPTQGKKCFVELIGKFRRGRIMPRGPITFAAVAKERKLRNNQQSTPYI